MAKAVERASWSAMARSTSLVLVTLSSVSGCAWFVQKATNTYMTVDSLFKPKHVKIELLTSFVERNKDNVQIKASFKVDKAMGSPLPAPIDGDLHFAGRSPQIQLAAVAEIANAAHQQEAVNLVHAAQFSGKPLELTGIFRIWPEHAASSKVEQGKHVDPLDSDTPDHVFEIHPITKINHLSIVSSFTTVDGFLPTGADKAFDTWQKSTCTISYAGDKIAIVAETGLPNDVEFIMQVIGPGREVTGGRFIPAAALNLDGKMRVDHLRMVFATNTPPEVMARHLKKGDRVHVYGMPRLDLEELARRVKELPRKGAEDKQPLPYEVSILGVYSK